MANETLNNDPFDKDNVSFRIAAAFVLETSRSLFLTGKAGTGKTTFLKYIRRHTNKNCAVVAPTGVAAINAGGETIHSLLQLPFGPYVPASAGGFGRREHETEDKHTLLSGLRMNEPKLKLLRKLDLLIIDEVSMLRADKLDAADAILRHVRKKPNQPFGGVQMLFIGDLFQLPPVVMDDDWLILHKYYTSPYFFDARVMQENPVLYLELKKIYRQKEQVFIDILNRVRNGKVLQADIDTLNTCYQPNATNENGYITLSTHNRTADEINKLALSRIEGPTVTFQGTIKDVFDVRNLPTDESITLKKGAQVMFIKNDLQVPRRFYNGKIATVVSLEDNGIFVKFKDEEKNEPLRVELDVWRNIKYSYNETTNQVEEKEVGSFTQFPLRLAWAVTVHKSQGLTLDRIVVDVNRAFASGQVYVALSRCTTFGGIVLKSKISVSNIFVDSRIVTFSEQQADEEELDEMLEQDRRESLGIKINNTVDFSGLMSTTMELKTKLLTAKLAPNSPALQKIEALYEVITKCQRHAETFQKHIKSFVETGEDAKMNERTSAAVSYFFKNLFDPCFEVLQAIYSTDNTELLTKRQLKQWKWYDGELRRKQEDLKKLVN